MNYFSIFELETKLLFEQEDEEKLEKKYLELTKEESVPGVISFKKSLFNEAYTTLKTELLRAEYMLKLLEIDILKLKPSQELISYILEIREDIADAETEQETKERVQDVVIELEEISINLDAKFKLAFSGKINREELEELFMKFKFLSEIIKKYKKI